MAEVWEPTALQKGFRCANSARNKEAEPMPSISTDRRALLLVQAFNAAGQKVQRVVIEGKRVEVVLQPDGQVVQSSEDEFEMVEMKR